MPIAVLAFEFDALLRLSGDLVVRWQTVALAALLLLVLLVVGVRARRTGTRPDDALAIAVAAVPGAVVGGRLAYAVVRPEAFATPGALFDPSIAGLELAGAVAGGLLTGIYVLSLLDAPLGRWAGLAAVPVLVLLGGGKLAMALGGAGQGLPSDAAWATAYVGEGPWGSLAPDLPSHPSQLYEGIGTLGFAVVLALVSAARGGRWIAGERRAAGGDARLLLMAIAGWALIRAASSTTWRDPIALGPLPTGGWLAVLLALAAAAGAAALTARGRRAAPGDTGVSGDGATDPAWPDPAARPRF